MTVETALPPLVELRGVVKRFGDFTANDRIDLTIRAGENHALLGENGAGKSTLVKILYGLLAPNEGEILWEGRPVALATPDDARALGIGMVFQHFSLFDNLTVGENIELVLPKDLRGRRLEERLAGVSERYGLALDPRRPVWTLSAGERQRIEIARCLLQDPRLIILDEPTSVLTPQEADNLFVTLDRLKSEGRALLYISHKLEEVKRLCDRATILRRGKVVAACDPKAESSRSMAALMVGQEVGEVRAAAGAAGQVRLSVRHLSMHSPDLHGVALKDVCFELRGGEVIGIAGIAGNGQAELFGALSGEELADTEEEVVIDGHACGRVGVSERRRLGAAFVPEERNGHAAVGDLSLSENVVLSRHASGDLVKGGFVLASAARSAMERIVSAFDVRKGAGDPLARTLSGGNLQKLVVGREILREPRILVVNQPTWGVDALAASTIRRALIDLARRGAAVLVISQDLDELFEMSDRLCVIHDGELSEPRPAATMTRDEIGLLMGGAAPVVHHEA